jgi:hypothetical protein
VAAKTKKRPVAKTNRPEPKAKPYGSTVSTEGQWLIAWQQKNPGMFMPGVSLQAAQSTGILAGYDPSKAMGLAQDPTWGMASLQNLAKQGKGPLAAGGAGTSGSLQGDGSEVGLSVPDYVASPELAAMRQMAGNRVGQIDQQAQYDQGQLDYRSGLGAGADPGNRFSSVNLLNRAFGRTLTGLETGAAAAGQRFSGQYQQQLDDASFGRSQGQYDLENQQRDASLGVSRQAEADKYGVAQGVAQGELSDRSNWYDQLRKMATPVAANT